MRAVFTLLFFLTTQRARFSFHFLWNPLDLDKSNTSLHAWLLLTVGVLWKTPGASFQLLLSKRLVKRSGVTLMHPLFSCAYFVKPLWTPLAWMLLWHTLWKEAHMDIRNKCPLTGRKYLQQSLSLQSPVRSPWRSQHFPSLKASTAIGLFRKASCCVPFLFIFLHDNSW